MDREISPYERWVKPTMDRVAAALLLTALCPILAAIALAVRARLGQGVIFRQDRVGRDGDPFVMYKFRTMHPDRRSGDMGFDGLDRRQTHKTNADPRHTRLGMFLRRYSLDELPQLWNVLRGDLSLVGPRPELVDVVRRKYEPWQHRRHVVRPGLTGLWQVTQRDDMGEMHRHVDVDLRYIQHLSLRLDLAIVVMTIPSLVNVAVPDVFGLRRLGRAEVRRPHDRDFAPAYVTKPPHDDAGMSA